MILDVPMTTKMNFDRDNEQRGGHPGEGRTGERSRPMPQNGFEGMNYEQRREPYKGNRQGSTRNGNTQQDASHNINKEGAA
jgi:hypothetical protein